jgi:hypothetical protein
MVAQRATILFFFWKKSQPYGCDFFYLLLWPSSRLEVWIYKVSKKTVGTNTAKTVARRPRKLVSINLTLIADF